MTTTLDGYLPKNTRVTTSIGGLQITGVVVRATGNRTDKLHIIKCTDGQLPNGWCRYDTFISPLKFITVSEVGMKAWARFDRTQQEYSED